MKYCKDCKHYYGSTTGLVPDICKSPNLPIDLVTGSPKFSLCKDQRYGLKPDVCGIEANWFEPIEDADLDDLSSIPFGK
jgi:hypothetical protein